ncbi:transcriptional regulator [Paenibacillus sp. J31TS4]|uniref:helix-turn-helix transcriptional regulator n=1 Tax=Paenibacillus sp. J31TS4 TaxID=2807195 RepID=UPI001B22EBB8|nr:helix-turn-helix transcriptional regulator [Paenibacillus sp. J31TS4]GIP41059.1 transcriptional regulator [Paenibacillus sp. J31TS4]
MVNRIKELRKERRLSQEDLAQACRVTRQTINAIENNKYDPSLQLAFQLSRVLGVPVDGLFSYQPESD